MTPLTPRILCVTMIVGLLALAAAAPAARAASAVDNDKLAAQTLAIFAQKCAECHAPEAKPKPKKFNYVKDLGKLAANPKFVTPGDPAKSVLLKQILDDEMPPEDSDVPQLTAAEKDIVRAWIAAGAPAGRMLAAGTVAAPTRSATADPGPTVRSDAPTTQPEKKPARPFLPRLITWLGRFHPLAAHTPIAVLMAAAISEMLYLRYRSPALTGASRFCTVLGAMGAVATAALGWAMAVGHSQSAMLEDHRWAGTIAGVAAIPIAIFGEWGSRRAQRLGLGDWTGASRWLYRIAVFGIAGYVGYTAHMGGLMQWGENFFEFPR